MHSVRLFPFERSEFPQVFGVSNIRTKQTSGTQVEMWSINCYCSTSNKKSQLLNQLVDILRINSHVKYRPAGLSAEK